MYFHDDAFSPADFADNADLITVKLYRKSSPVKTSPIDTNFCGLRENNSCNFVS